MKMTAIIVAAGRGKRMESDTAKQYLLLHEKPVLYYSVKAFEEAQEIDSVIIVTGESEIEYVKEEIVKRYGFQKADAVVAGGEERYHSVYNGLRKASGCDYVFIHDGARPFIDGGIIGRADKAVREYQAVVAGMPVKDTVKIADQDGFISITPSRELVWAVQTPQVFAYPLVMEAYETLIMKETELSEQGIVITDDAMVVETFTRTKVRLVEGSYRNRKITTPEDLEIAEALLKENTVR